MAWDTARTRETLLVAASAEFAARGFAGARVDAIATAAGINKERIYGYFGGKNGLFEAVLERKLSALFALAELQGTGPAAAGEYAACLFDAYAADPQLPRLLAWEGLERAEPLLAQEHRAAGCAAERAALRQALPGLSEADAGRLLLAIVALVGAYWTLPQLPAVMLPTGAADDRRAMVIAAATAIASGY